jgi:quercetin dioxygenase-like cupin family protein
MLRTCLQQPYRAAPLLARRRTHTRQVAAMADAPAAGSGGVLHLPTLLPVKPGGVATRALLPFSGRAPGGGAPFGGALTLLSFDAGAELREHTTPHEAMIIVIEGDCVVTLRGIPHALRVGDAIALPAGAPHAVRSTGPPFKMLLSKARAEGEAAGGAAAATAGGA